MQSGYLKGTEMELNIVEEVYKVVGRVIAFLDPIGNPQRKPHCNW